MAGAQTENGKITFRPGDGRMEAVCDGKVVGYVYTNDYVIKGREKNDDRTGAGDNVGRQVRSGRP